MQQKIIQVRPVRLSMFIIISKPNPISLNRKPKMKFKNQHFCGKFTDWGFQEFKRRAVLEKSNHVLLMRLKLTKRTSGS